MGMCMSRAEGGEAGGGHGDAPHSAVLGCCDVWEPVAECLFLGDACSVWLWYFEKYVLETTCKT